MKPNPYLPPEADDHNNQPLTRREFYEWLWLKHPDHPLNVKAREDMRQMRKEIDKSIMKVILIMAAVIGLFMAAKFIFNIP
jgi:hypothetical protein